MVYRYTAAADGEEAKKYIRINEIVAKPKPSIIDFLLPILTASMPTGMNATAEIPIEIPDMTPPRPDERFRVFVR